MFLCAAAFLFAISFSFEKPFMAQAKLYNADCTYVELKTSQKNGNKTSLMHLTSQIPLSRNLVYSCIVKTQHKQYFIFER